MHTASWYAVGFELAISILREPGDATLLRLEGSNTRLALLDSLFQFHQGMLVRQQHFTPLIGEAAAVYAQ